MLTANLVRSYFHGFGLAKQRTINYSHLYKNIQTTNDMKKQTFDSAVKRENGMEHWEQKEA